MNKERPPLPWDWHELPLGIILVIDANKNEIMQLSNKEVAKQVVKSVNSHNRLIEAVEKLSKTVDLNDDYKAKRDANKLLDKLSQIN